MPTPDSVVPIEQLLETARRRVAETSLRVAAAEIGMEHSGLDKLLKRDQRPRPSTVRKLNEWYIQRAAAGQVEISPDVSRLAIAILVQHFPTSLRESAADQLQNALVEMTVEKKISLPPWLKGK